MIRNLTLSKNQKFAVACCAGTLGVLSLVIFLVFFNNNSSNDEISKDHISNPFTAKKTIQIRSQEAPLETEETKGEKKKEKPQEGTALVASEDAGDNKTTNLSKREGTRPLGNVPVMRDTTHKGGKSLDNKEDENDVSPKEPETKHSNKPLFQEKIFTASKLKDESPEALLKMTKECTKIIDNPSSSASQKNAALSNKALISLVNFVKSSNSIAALEWMENDFKVRDNSQFDEFFKKQLQKADRSNLIMALEDAEKMHKHKASCMEHQGKYEEVESEILETALSKVLLGEVKSGSLVPVDNMIKLPNNLYKVLLAAKPKSTEESFKYGTEKKSYSVKPELKNLLHSQVRELRQACVDVLEKSKEHEQFIRLVEQIQPNELILFYDFNPFKGSSIFNPLPK